MFAPTSLPLVIAGLCSNMNRNKPFVENLDFQEHFISTTEFQIFKIASSRNRDNCKKKKKNLSQLFGN